MPNALKRSDIISDYPCLDFVLELTKRIVKVLFKNEKTPPKAGL